MDVEPSVHGNESRGTVDVETGARRLSASSRHAQLTPPDLGVPAGPRRGTPPALAVTGGALLAVATAGAWVRETVVAEVGASPEVVAETLGVQVTGGPVLIALGVLLACSGPLWVRAGDRVRRLLAGLSGLVAAVATVVLVRLQATLDASVAAAIEAADVTAHHIGVGWGAWAAGAAVAACGLAAVTELVTPAPAGTSGEQDA